MEERIELLKKVAEKAIESLTRVKISGVKRKYSFDVDCLDLDDYKSNDIRKSEKYCSLFIELAEIKGPVLYWFEIISGTNSHTILNAIMQYKLSNGSRAVPAIRKKVNHESKVLYLGKVKGIFWGRIITHLGYFTTPVTQGLQLFHWGRNIGLKVKVNVLEFHDDCKDLLPVFEYAFANQLNPIIGKHK